MVEKAYVQMITGQDRIRVRFRKDRGKITAFVVEYETLLKDEWMAIVRYDTARGQPGAEYREPGRTKNEFAALPKF